MNRVYLLLGSNMGDRQAMLDSANMELIDALLPDYLEVESLGDAVNTSQVIETEPWGFEAPEKFLNQSFCCLTELEPHEVLAKCMEIEKGLGRDRSEPVFNEAGERIYRSRVIDIDILAFERKINGEWKAVVVDDDDLTIPHPQLQTRDFAGKLYNELKAVGTVKTKNKKK